MNERLLTWCENPIQAEELKEQLEAAGIQCVVFEQTMANGRGVCDGKMVTHAVYVDDSCYEKAQKLMTAAECQRQEQLPWCPKCGAEDVKKIDNSNKEQSWLQKLWYACFVNNSDNYECMQCHHIFHRK